MNSLKNILIAALIVTLGLIMFFGGSRVTRFEEEIGYLKGENSALMAGIAARDSAIDAAQLRADSLEAVIKRLKKDYSALEKEKKNVETKLSEALAQLQTITADSSYRFLQEVYKYPGVLRFLFNELQVKGIHADYIRLQASDETISLMEHQITNCIEQTGRYELIKSNLEKIIEVQETDIKDYRHMLGNDSTIIRDQKKTIAKERNRKSLWRTSSGALLLILIGSIL